MHLYTICGFLRKLDASLEKIHTNREFWDSYGFLSVGLSICLSIYLRVNLATSMPPLPSYPCRCVCVFVCVCLSLCMCMCVFAQLWPEFMQTK